MMHRSMKPLGRGGQEYFNEKRPVNGRVGGTAHLAETLPPPGDADVDAKRGNHFLLTEVRHQH
jgi:hypothetical protein